MRRRNTYMRSLVVVLCGLVLAFASFGAVDTAGAQQEATQSATTVIQGELRLNCTDMTPKARKYANEHRLCPTMDPGSVQPNNTVPGTCGFATLYIYQGYATQIARVDQGLASTVGTIVWIWRTVDWTNQSRQTTGAQYLSTGNFGSTWTRSDWFNTDTGYVSATMYGTVQLIWGGTCTINYPVDVTIIN